MNATIRHAAFAIFMLSTRLVTSVAVAETINFDKAETGKPPAGWTATQTGSGQARWTGLYGLSGNFEGWFSNDEARVPIKAKMSVYIGSVVIELKSWKRPDWKPPKSD